MKDKVDEAAKKVPVTEESVTDNELDAAFQAALNGEVEIEEEPKGETTPPSLEEDKGENEANKPELDAVKKEEVNESDEHSEKSRLGRKFKRLEEENQKLQEKLDLVLETFSKKEKVPVVKDEDEDDIDDNDTVITAKDVKKILEKHEAQRGKRQSEDERKTTEAQQVYEKGYIRKILEFEEEPDFKVIYDEMFKNYNTKLTGNPETDAEINFERATAAFYKKARKEKKVPVKGNPPDNPTGMDNPTTKHESTKKKIELDDIASEYVQRLGIPEDKVQEWLGTK